MGVMRGTRESVISGGVRMEGWRANHRASQGRRAANRSISTWVALAGMLALVVAGGCALLPASVTSRLVTPSTSITVCRGDSLWSIAQAHPVPSRSTRDVVEWIRERNGLTSALIHVGDRLEVPCQDRATADGCHGHEVA